MIRFHCHLTRTNSGGYITPRTNSGETVFIHWLTGRLLAWVILCSVIGCSAGDHKEVANRLAEGSANLEDGTAAMVEMLSAIADTTDQYPQINAHANRARVQRLKSLPLPESEKSRLSYRLRLAGELLNAGASLDAAELYEQVLRTATQRPDLLDLSDRLAVRDMAAIAWMRVGEQENSIDNPILERNLWPIQGAGIHRIRRGSERAAVHYSALLNADPDDLNSLWLINVAHMALGNPPDSIPPAWRLPRVLAEADIGRFTDRAASAGVDIEGRSGGLIMEDFNGDGMLDLLAASWGLRDQIQLLINRGDGTFENRTDAAGLTGIVSGLNMVHADFDNDGDFDVYVLRGAWLGMGHPNSLLRNNGDGTFSDVTQAAGILNPQPSHSADWADFDGDGDVDLFVGAESTDGDRLRASRLYRNEGDGTFRDVAADVGLAITAFVKGVAWGDYNGDGRPDLYVSNLAAPNLLFRNDGPTQNGGWQFEEVGEQAGVHVPYDSFPTWFWDYDQDGRMDLFVSGWRATVGDLAAELLGRPFHAEPPRLYRNLGDGTFEDATDIAGLNRVLYTMGTNYGDLDNDGYPDFYVGTGDPEFRALMPSRMFRNVEGQRFEEVTSTGGFGNLQKGHGVAFGDLDHDGDQDVYVVMGGAFEGDLARNVLYENPGHGHNWITIQLVGDRANRAGLGARIRLDLMRDSDAARSVFRTVGTGGSFGSSSYRQHIGIGMADSIDRLVIEWPGSGTRQDFHNLKANRHYRIIESGQHPEVIELPSFRFLR